MEGDILGSPDWRCCDLKAEPAGRCLNLAHLQNGRAISDIDHDRQTLEMGDSLTQDF
jgi:hypothetical protein